MKDKLFLNAPNALIVIDPIDNKIVEANEKALQLFGIDRDELLNSSVTSCFSECVGELYNFTEEIKDKGQAWSSDLFIDIEGKKLFLEITANQFEQHLIFSCQFANESFARFHASLAESNYQAGLLHWNASEAAFQEIEKQNQLLLSAVGDGIYGVDLEGHTTFVNQAAEQLLGWQREELVGKPIHHMIHHSHENGDCYHVHECPIYSAFRDGTVRAVDNEVFWHKQGHAIAVEYKSTPVREDGRLIGAVVVFRDITQRKAMQQKLVDALEEVDSLKARLEMDNAYLLEEINADFNHHRIIGQSMKVQHMLQQISLVAPTDANVLITGESGTGKELIARSIHEMSERKARPLIRVNCAAIPADLFESEFFGHAKGAFSGAVSDRVGRFELADGATIFLDEVGEIPIQLQGKLLRVLQEQQFERVGESKTRHVDVRVISATNQHLKTLVEQQKFREDLYYRLNVFPIHSPPLRERSEDIPHLVKHFVEKVCINFNRPQPEISVAQMKLLSDYPWPGNIRELENIIERQIILARSNRVDFNFLIDEKVHNQPEPGTSNTVTYTSVNTTMLSAQDQKLLEKNSLIQALKQCRGKIYGDNGAANLLGLKPTTLASRLKKYQIDRREFVA